mmetsp:Transcript_35631/g.65349  ORF Transcript_35631/g.65349 Transcript_35631/m.65349 type:complete len:443 (+) Transcript_35631:120-1448(+)
MKVQMIVKSSCKGQVTSVLETLNITITPADTVLSIKSRISDVKPTAFPDQEVFFNGEALKNEQRISDCGIKEGDALEYVCVASEKVLAQQLSDLLGTQAVSLEELGLLYVHRHGVTVGESLKTLGRGGEKLQDFLEGSKTFILKGGVVSVVGAEKIPDLKTIEEDKVFEEGNFEVSAIITAQGAGQTQEEDVVDVILDASDTVAKAKERIASVGLVPFPDQDLVLDDKVLADGQPIRACGVKKGMRLTLVVRASETVLVERLEDLVRARTVITINDLSHEYCNRFGTPVVQALKALSLAGDLRCFLEGRREQFSVNGGCVKLADTQIVVPPPQLPSRVMAEAAERVMDLVKEAAAFLNIHRMAKGTGARASQVTIYFNGLPPAAEDRWLPGLLSVLSTSLAASLDKNGTKGIESVALRGNSVEVLTEELVTVTLRVASAAVP